MTYNSDFKKSDGTERSVCPSVRGSVGLSVGPSKTRLFFLEDVLFLTIVIEQYRGAR